MKCPSKIGQHRSGAIGRMFGAGGGREPARLVGCGVVFRPVFAYIGVTHDEAAAMGKARARGVLVSGRWGGRMKLQGEAGQVGVSLSLELTAKEK